MLETYETLPLVSLTLSELLTAQLIFNLTAMKEKVAWTHKKAADLGSQRGAELRSEKGAKLRCQRGAELKCPKWAISADP